MPNIYRVYFSVIVCLLLSCYSPPHYKKILSESYVNKDVKDYKTIELVFTGTAIDRTILENIGAVMIKKLKKKNVLVTTTFLSDNNKTSASDLVVINNTKADAIMFFTPLNGAVVKEYYSGVQGLETRLAVTNQRYDLRLFDKTKKDKPVWGARLNLHLEIDSKKGYQKVADAILKSLHANLIFNN